MIVTLSFLSFWNYAQSEEMEGSLDQDQQTKFVTAKDDRFIASDGRQIILHGVNIVEKNKSINYLSWHGSKEFAKMREWGFNCIRLGVIWDGVEPEPGKYDDNYLAGLDKRIQWAKDNGIYVILDMHQDLFSVKYSDGAPEWATLDEGKPHIHSGGVWSEAYFTSPAIQTAFDNFWQNKPVSDGVGVQDHFAMMWQHVAKRYANEPTVIGYDLFNEPFPGSSIIPTMLSKLKSALKVIAKKQGKPEPTDAEITQVFMQPGSLMTYAENFDNYRAFCDGDNSLVWEFENTILASFYKRLSDAIREVDKNHIIFLETHIICNSGTPTGITPILNKKGDKDPLQALAPHGYDIYTDTDKVANSSYERIKLIFDRHSEAGKRWKMPVIVGEWEIGRAHV
jgi:endoglycosylceramidase